MRYEKIFKLERNLIARQFLERRKLALKELDAEKPTWWPLSNFMTDSAIRSYLSGSLSRDKAEARILRSYDRQLDKELAELESRLAKLEKAPDFKGGRLEVEWRRSSTWGYNPSATFAAYSASVTEGYASGCGYDKLSTCAARCFNDCDSVIKMLVEKAERLAREGKITADVMPHEVFPNGLSSTSYIPCFEGGVGISCHQNIFAFCGWDMRGVASGRAYDAFLVERRQPSFTPDEMSIMAVALSKAVYSSDSEILFSDTEIALIDSAVDKLEETARLYKTVR